MKGDFTRSTFDPEKHYSSVRMQQGRVQLDADWNEQVDILAHLNQLQIRDLIGLSGVPNSDNNAQSFEISSIPGERDFTIASGRIYVDGILCELEKETKYTEQPDYPNALREDLKQEDLPEGEYIAYLDVWQRHITSVDDPQIRETALGNVPDTATRTKTVWQVKLLKLNNLNNINVEEELAKFLQSAKQEWNNFLKQQQDREIALNPKVSDDANLDNHLYRVEIHEGGEAGKATFKWSRDNGFVVSAIEKIDGNIITISQNNDEAWQLARPRQWVEIIRSDSTENWELAGKPGILARLQRVSGNKLIIDPASIKNPRELILPDKFDREDKLGASFYKIRLWDYTIDTGETAGIPIPSDDTEYIPLEEGLEIKFTGRGDYQTYQTGDYWLIPTRKNSRNHLDWPTNGDDSSPYQQLPPNGIEHHYSCLATIVLTDQQELKIQDCRKPFISLVDYLDRLKGLNPEDFKTDILQVKGKPENKAQGEISNITDLSLRYAGKGFKELSVGDTIIVKEPTPNNDKQVRSIQTIDQVTQILTINEPFESPLDNQEFFYQKPLALFSDSSGENKLTLNSLGLDFNGKIKTTELEIPGTFEVETFRVNGLEIGIRQNQDSFLNYGLIQAEEVNSDKQISFTAENDVRFAFLKKQDDGTPSEPLIVIDERLKVGGIVDATDFFLNGTQWILDTERISDGAITTAKLADDAVNGDKLSDNAVDTIHISDGAITTAKLVDDAVNGDKLSDNAVDTNHIRNGAVTTAKLVDDAVTAEKLSHDDADDDQKRAVTTNHIRNGAVTTAKLVDDAVTAEKLSHDDADDDQKRAVTTNHIRNGAVTTAKLVDDAVTAEKLRDETDDANDLQRAVTTDHIRNGAVNKDKLSDDAVTAEKLRDETDDANDLQRAVTTDHIRNNAVNEEKLSDNAVTAEKLRDETDDANDLQRAVTTNHIRNGAVNRDKLSDDAVTAEKLRDETDDANDLQRAVTTDHIRNNAVNEEKLSDNAVTAEKLRDETDDANDLQRAVTTNHIRNGAVTAEKLDSSVSRNLCKWLEGDNGSISYNNGNVALGTAQATASLQVQGSKSKTASGTISGGDLVKVTGHGTSFTAGQQGSFLIAANEIGVIREFLSATEVTVDLLFSESLSEETFAIVPVVQDVTISPSSSNQTTIKINGDIPEKLSENDIIIAAGQIRTVLTVPETSNEESSNELTIDIAFKEPLQDLTPFAILEPEANITVSGWHDQTRSGNWAIAKVRVEGDVPSNLVKTGDFIIAAGQLKKVETIDDANSSFTVTPPFREPLPSNINLFILSQQEGTITTEIIVAGDAGADFNQLHVGDVLSVETETEIETTTQTRLITGIIAQNKLTIDAPFDPSLNEKAFAFQQPIARFVDSQAQPQLIINAEGNVGIGTSIPTAKLQVDGPVLINDDLWCKGTLLQSSSLTLKTNIVELSRQEANQILRELNPIKFNYKEDRLNHPHIGFIAEDVPDLVASSDKKAICPVDIVAVLTKTVQYHEQTISQLTNLIDEQKHEIAILQENFTRLSGRLQKKQRRKKLRKLTIRAFWKQLRRLCAKTFRLVVSERDRI